MLFPDKGISIHKLGRLASRESFIGLGCASQETRMQVQSGLVTIVVNMDKRAGAPEANTRSWGPVTVHIQDSGALLLLTLAFEMRSREAN